MAPLDQAAAILLMPMLTTDVSTGLAAAARSSSTVATLPASPSQLKSSPVYQAI
jgi:hypothetical protein